MLLLGLRGLNLLGSVLRGCLFLDGVDRAIGINAIGAQERSILIRRVRGSTHAVGDFAGQLLVELVGVDWQAGSQVSGQISPAQEQQREAGVNNRIGQRRIAAIYPRSGIGPAQSLVAEEDFDAICDLAGMAVATGPLLAARPARSVWTYEQLATANVAPLITRWLPVPAGADKDTLAMHRAAMEAAICLISACAWATVTPGRRRA